MPEEPGEENSKCQLSSEEYVSKSFPLSGWCMLGVTCRCNRWW